MNKTSKNLKHYREYSADTYFTVFFGSSWFFSEFFANKQLYNLTKFGIIFSITNSTQECLKFFLALGEDKENLVCYTLFFLTLEPSFLINAQGGITLYFLIYTVDFRKSYDPGTRNKDDLLST